VSLRLSGGRLLTSPPGQKARPTAGRVRQAVMNLLAPELPGCRWLDLCCGSGVMGCEALQRGARQVVGVERDRRIAAVARTNLEKVAAAHPEARAEVHAGDVFTWLGKEAPRPFDLIYVDPPYSAGLHGPIAAAVRQGGWMAPDGTLVWECAADAVAAVPAGWRERDRRRYGGTVVVLLGLSPGTSAAEGAAAAVLVPGGHEQPHQGDGDEAEHDPAEEGFDHGRKADRGRPGGRATILP
jgi:16S rRNA (guanine(966)-N(2))-methyltransferase RsmD